MLFSTRLTLYYLIATLLTLSLVGVAILKGIEHNGMAAVERQLIEQSDSANVYITQTLLLQKLGAAGLSEVADRVANNLSIGNREVRIYDSEFNLLTASVDGLKQEETTTKTSATQNLKPALEGNYAYYISNNKVYFASAIELRQQTIGILEFVYPLNFLNQVLTAARHTLYAGAVGFALLITILSVYIARIVVQPIRQLVEASNRFAQRDFTPLELKRNDELGQLSRSFSAMGSELQHYIQRQRQFVANVSHELRTPLTAIKGYSDYLIDEVKGRPDLEKAVYHLNNESDRLARLVDELLLLSRIDADRDELLLNPLDLTQLVAEALVKIQAKADKYNITISKLLQPGIVIMGDQEKLLQVILNLLDNAIKFSPNGGSVEVQLTADNTSAYLTVVDRGKGVPEGSLDKVFERFYRAPNAKAVGGTGLGLSICQEIINAHHGTLQLKNRPGGGTEVVTTLKHGCSTAEICDC